ncbi:MAG: hypothetical protein JXR07_16305 [Reichenbachiella sp.]
MKKAAISIIFDFPATLAKCSIFDIGKGKSYIDMSASAKAFELAYSESIKKEIENVVEECENKDIKLSVYFSGLFIDLLVKTDSLQLEKIKRLVKKGKIEILGGTINHSLASIYSPSCFEWEIISHLDLMKRVFDVSPKKFYNTENLFNDAIASEIIKLGFNTTFAGVVEWYLGNEVNQRVFKSAVDEKFTTLLIEADKQNALFENDRVKNHFLQFDLNKLTQLGGFKTILGRIQSVASVSQLDDLLKDKSKAVYKVKSPTIGSIHSKSLSSYNGEAMQRNALEQYYDLCDTIEKCQYEDFMKEHAELGHSSLFLQMSKSSESSTEPFETYSNYINMVTDLTIRLGRKP